MVTRNPDPESGAKGVAGPVAVEHLDRLVTAVEGLLARPDGALSPLDRRLAELAAERKSLQRLAQGTPPISPRRVGGSRDRLDRDWTDGVFAAICAGTALDEAMPETHEASTARRALHALLDSLRHEVDLEQLRDAWPGIRSALRCYVLGLVREDAAEDLEALDRALVSCGVRPLDLPEPNPAGATLRVLLRHLLATRETHRARFKLRRAFLNAYGREATPLRGRYLLAHALAKASSPDQSPALPPSLVAPALILLATLDLLDARAGQSWPQRAASAYKVLRAASVETRWPAEQRALMEAVLSGGGLSDATLLGLGQYAVHTQGTARTGQGPADQATGGEAPLGTGDGTETSRARFLAGSSEVSSPAGPGSTPPTGSPGAPPQDPGSAPVPPGGDGTETSKAPFAAGPRGVSSPRGRVVVAVRLIAFKESMETGMGAPREGGWVQGILLRRDEPPKDLRVSRQQYTAMVALAKERIVVFPAGAAGRKARDRLRRTLSSWGVRVAGGRVKSQAPRQRGERPTLLRLKSPFTVHLTDGIADRDGTARRLVREAERDAYLGQY